MTRQLDEFDSKHPKYILDWNNSLDWKGHTLYKVVYKNSFTDQEGGWIEGYNNLSQNNFCKVLGNAKVYENALVADTSIVADEAEVYGDVKVCMRARVLGDTSLYGNLTLYNGVYIMVPDPEARNIDAPDVLVKYVQECM